MILLSTSDFIEKGGWFVDAQFMDQMGSPYLLAHGLGRPVEDAVGRVALPVSATRDASGTVGTWRVWVRTRDWVSPQGPGRFVVKIGEWTSKELGVGRGDWHWEDCGVVDLRSVAGSVGSVRGVRSVRGVGGVRGGEWEIEIRLHDLTGFDARCAAIALTAPDEDINNLLHTLNPSHFSNPSNPSNLSHPSNLSYDFAVVGGGYAGMCAAVAAARRGVKTILIQDRPVLGGNASSEVRVGPIGQLGLGPFPGLSGLPYELMVVTKGKGTTSGGLRPIPDNRKINEWVGKEKNLTVLLSTRCVGVRCEGFERCEGCEKCEGCERWVGEVEVFDVESGERKWIRAKMFADCTGDARLAELAGAVIRTEPEKGESIEGGYGSTNFWTTRWTEEETTFPACPWALKITEENWQVNRPKFFVEGDYPYAAGWNWESGFDKDAVRDGEWIRDHNLRAAFGMWDYLKNRAPDKDRYAKAEMDWLGVVLGKRAARRIEGDYVLTEQDLVEHRVYSDGVVPTTWFLDLHFPHPMNAMHFPEGAFRSMAFDDPKYAELCPNRKGRQVRIAPYPIPYRCFYSKNIGNLFMAGKDISCSHVAMSSVRVENTTAMMGALVGESAALCLHRGWSPRELGERHFDALSDRLIHIRLSKLAKRGRRIAQARTSLKGEIKYWLRPAWRMIKRSIGRN